MDIFHYQYIKNFVIFSCICIVFLMACMYNYLTSSLLIKSWIFPFFFFTIHNIFDKSLRIKSVASYMFTAYFQRMKIKPSPKNRVILNFGKLLNQRPCLGYFYYLELLIYFFSIQPICLRKVVLICK